MSTMLVDWQLIFRSIGFLYTLLHFLLIFLICIETLDSLALFCCLGGGVGGLLQIGKLFSVMH